MMTPIAYFLTGISFAAFILLMNYNYEWYTKTDYQKFEYDGVSVHPLFTVFSIVIFWPLVVLVAFIILIFRFADWVLPKLLP